MTMPLRRSDRPLPNARAPLAWQGTPGSLAVDRPPAEV